MEPKPLTFGSSLEFEEGLAKDRLWTARDTTAKVYHPQLCRYIESSLWRGIQNGAIAEYAEHHEGESTENGTEAGGIDAGRFAGF